MKLGRHLTDRDAGILIPWYWGYAWREPYLRTTYMLPIPLNLIARWGRDALYRVRRGKRERLLDAAESAGIQDGRHWGLKDGYRAGRRHERNAHVIRVRQVVDEHRADGPAMKLQRKRDTESGTDTHSRVPST